MWFRGGSDSLPAPYFTVHKGWIDENRVCGVLPRFPITFISYRYEYIVYGGKMKTITTRISEDLLKKLEEIEQDEKADRSTIIRKLLDKAVGDWKIEKALEELRGGRITLRTAARKAELTYVEMLDRAKEAGIQLGYTAEDLQNDLANLEE